MIDVDYFVDMLQAVHAIVIAGLLAVLSRGGDPVSVAWHTAVAFIFGAICSALAGFIGGVGGKETPDFPLESSPLEQNSHSLVDSRRQSVARSPKR